MTRKTLAELEAQFVEPPMTPAEEAAFDRKTKPWIVPERKKKKRRYRSSGGGQSARARRKWLASDDAWAYAERITKSGDA